MAYENDAKKLKLLIKKQPEIFEQISFGEIYLDTDLENYLKKAFSEFLKEAINYGENVIINAMIYLYKDCYDAEFDYDEYEESFLKILIVNTYCKLNKNVTLAYVLENYESIKLDILKVLNEKYRYLLFDKVLGMTCELEESKFCLENFDTFTRLLQVFKNSSEFKNINVTEYDRLSKNQLNAYVKEFLLKVEPTGKWYKLYNGFVRQGKIKVVNPGEDWEYVKEGRIELINAPLENNISDFPKIIHEFIHVIGATKFPNNYSTNYYSDEIASIYYEKLACLFLESKKYDKKQVNSLFENRLSHSICVCDLLITLLMYMQVYLDNKNIKEEIYEDADTAIDNVNKLFVLNSSALTQGIMYVLGEFFSQEALEKNLSMTEFAENCKFMSFDSVLYYFDTEKNLFVNLNDQRT